MAELPYNETPIVDLVDEIAIAAGVSISVKREDLNHLFVSGNKWWKLKLNLADAVSQGHDTLLTFGGAYSNHIYATAAAASTVGLKSIGVIRGVQTEPYNETLRFAQEHGMKLHFVTRADYREKEKLNSQLTSIYGRFYTVPEGGSNEAGIIGVSLFASQLPRNFDYVCCPIGTGATFTGVIRGFQGHCFHIGFPVLKGGDSWREEVLKYDPQYNNWTLATEYHCGGYAKTHPALEDFIKDFSNKHLIPLEHVYSGKMFYGIMDLISKGFFKRGTKILAIHTGGVRTA